MAFVILETSGEPLRDMQGHLFVVDTRAEAKRWLKRGERVRPFDPVTDQQTRRRTR